MTFLAGGFIPFPYTVSADANGWLALVLPLVLAFAVTIALVYAARPVAKAETRVELPTPIELRKAA